MKHTSILLGSLILSLTACTTDNKNDQNTETELDTSTAPLSAEGEWAKGYAEDMQALVDSSSDFEKLNQLEALVEQGEEQLFGTWQESWKSGELDAYNALIAEQTSGIDWANAQSTEERSLGGITESNVNFPSGMDSVQEY